MRACAVATAQNAIYFDGHKTCVVDHYSGDNKDRSLCLRDPSIQEILAAVMMGTSIYGVLLINGYLCSREYGIYVSFGYYIVVHLSADTIRWRPLYVVV